MYSVCVFSSVSVAQRKLHRKCVYSVCVFSSVSVDKQSSEGYLKDRKVNRILACMQGLMKIS